MFIVYTLFAQFRTEEFKERLAEKAITTIRLLNEVKEVDNQLLKIIDKNSINQLYNEKILVFNEQLEVVYSSIDDAPITWKKEELRKIKEEKSTLKKNGEYEVYGMFYDTRNKDYYALVSADDKYGKSRLKFLRYLLIGAFIVGSSLVWILSFYLSKKALRPLDTFRSDITDITENNLNKRLPERDRKDEISILSNAFNEMLKRIDLSYNRQKVFTSNASHELRTPIARIVTQLENLINDTGTNPATGKALRLISQDCYQLSDIISSLLILTKIDNSSPEKGFKKLRLDEIVFYAEERMKNRHPDFKFQFEIESGDDSLDFEVEGDETLLRIAIGNLLKNGYLYSSDGMVSCVMKTSIKKIELRIINKGETPGVEDTSLLFNSFSRGKNSQNKSGSGLGLSIVKNILTYHDALVEYKLPSPNTNELIVTFKV
jgi:signal transduction histidine kinase